jgi:hypothetical protein
MGKPTSIYLLLSTYWRRVDDLTEAMRRTDEAAYGTPERDAAFAEQRLVGEHLNESERAVAAFLPEGGYEAKIKADFLAHLAAGNNGTLSDDVAASLIETVPHLLRNPNRGAFA